MEKQIQISNFTKSGFSMQDAQTVAKVIDQELNTLADSDSILLDFTGVKFYTTLFFNTALSRLLGDMPLDEYRRRIHIIGLTEVGQNAYKHSLANAIDYYRMTPDQRKQQQQDMVDFLDDEQE